MIPAPGCQESGGTKVGLELSPRAVPAELVRHYRAAGFWDDSTLGVMLVENLTAHPRSRVRIWSQVRPYEGTIGDVTDLARRVAGGLRRHGIGAGDVVSFQFPNWVEAVASFYAAALIGAVVVPIVHIYGAKEVGYILRESRSRAHLTAAGFAHLDYVGMMEGLAPALPDLEHIVVLGSGPPAGFETFADLAESPAIRAAATVDPDAPAVLGYTSGTTANPKGVVHSHRSLLAEVRQLTYPAPPLIAPLQVPPGNRPVLLGSPVSHATGMLGALLSPVVRGDDINLIDRWDPGAVLSAMLEGNLTSGGGATYFLTSLLDHPDLSHEHLERMRYVGLGGAPIPAAVADRAAAKGISLVRAYGSTEHPSVTGSAHGDPAHQRLHTDGRAMRGVEIRIVAPDGSNADVGDPGEVHTRGPELFIAYTDAALTTERVDRDGWYATGDIGVLDELGFLTVTDRTSDVIIRGGENISAAEVEELMTALPGVAEVAVVAAPDLRLGEHACAFIRPAPSALPPDIDAVRHHLESAGLARQKWPEELRLVEDFERTASGKIKKFVLRQRLSLTS